MNTNKIINFKDIDTLTNALKATIVLAKIIKNDYHKKGLLHLNPLNISVKMEPFIEVYFSDYLVDVFHKTDMNESNCPPSWWESYISHTSKFCFAPEQLRSSLKDVDERTDIYCIGAILFNNLMGRWPRFKDIKFGATWSFEGEKFANVSNRTKDKLANLFNKALTHNRFRRYWNIDAFIKDIYSILSDIKSDEMISGKHYSISARELNYASVGRCNTDSASDGYIDVNKFINTHLS